MIFETVSFRREKGQRKHYPLLMTTQTENNTFQRKSYFPQRSLQRCSVFHSLLHIWKKLRQPFTRGKGPFKDVIVTIILENCRLPESKVSIYPEQTRLTTVALKYVTWSHQPTFAYTPPHYTCTFSSYLTRIEGIIKCEQSRSPAKHYHSEDVSVGSCNRWHWHTDRQEDSFNLKFNLKYQNGTLFWAGVVLLHCVVWMI